MSVVIRLSIQDGIMRKQGITSRVDLSFVFVHVQVEIRLYCSCVVDIQNSHVKFDALVC
jgi:hypothetical protein